MSRRGNPTRLPRFVGSTAAAWFAVCLLSFFWLSGAVDVVLARRKVFARRRAPEFFDSWRVQELLEIEADISASFRGDFYGSSKLIIASE
jgi:hypothetical protein